MRETKSEFQANQTIQMIQSTDGKENQKKKKSGLSASLFTSAGDTHCWFSRLKDKCYC